MRVLADAVVLLHLAFIAFALLGGFLALRWRWLPWLHLPALAWGAWVELSGSICPLTPLENHLRAQAGLATYGGDFMGQYLLPVIYPAGLTRETQFVLAAVLVATNALAYGMWWRLRSRRSAPLAKGA